MFAQKDGFSGDVVEMHIVKLRELIAMEGEDEEIQLTKTKLGYEFSAGSGLYGIFDGYGKRAKIQALWSGISCNFR